MPGPRIASLQTLRRPPPVAGIGLGDRAALAHRRGAWRGRPPPCRLDEVNAVTGSIVLRCGGTRYVINVHILVTGPVAVYELLVGNGGEGDAASAPRDATTSAQKPAPPAAGPWMTEAERALLRAASDLLAAAEALEGVEERRDGTLSAQLAL